MTRDAIAASGRWYHAPDCRTAYDWSHDEALCTCSIHPGPDRGYPAERDVLSGSFVVAPAEHVGHTMTVLGPYGVEYTPSYKPHLWHRVRCSCGEERIMADDVLRESLGKAAA